MGKPAILLCALLLAACDPSMMQNLNLQNSNYTPSSSNYDRSSSGPSLSNLDKRQRDALKRGCRDRYGDHTSKYQQCVDGDRHSEDALVQGCNETWAKDTKRLRQCLGL